MSTVPNRVNVKLARLFYKYMEESKERQNEKAEKEQKEMEIKSKEKDYESYPPYNFSWFIPNKIAAMGWPRTEENLNYLVDVGINHLITLSPERRPPIASFKRKLKWSEIRVKEFEAPTLKQVLKFIEICERAEMIGEVVGVHCRQGRGRTGTMLACALVRGGMAPERAVLTVRLQRPGSCETYDQEKLVCHYHDCVRGTIPKPDYRLVEDKVYFDINMKYTYGEEKTASSDEETVEEKIVELGQEEKSVKLKLRKKKSNAMVIHHKIYF